MADLIDQFADSRLADDYFLAGLKTFAVQLMKNTHPTHNIF